MGKAGMSLWQVRIKFKSPAELPLGAVTALIGVPFFLTRLRRLA